MISDFKKQTRETISLYLAELVKTSGIYSCELKNFVEHLGNKRLFLFASKLEVVLMLVDTPIKHGQLEELADEEPFQNEDPMWFTETSHRPSPCWLLSEGAKEYRQILEYCGRDVPTVWCILLTSSSIINSFDMVDEWERLGISVIDDLNGSDLAQMKLKTNSNKRLLAYQRYVAPLFTVENEEDEEWEKSDPFLKFLRRAKEAEILESGENKDDYESFAVSNPARDLSQQSSQQGVLNAQIIVPIKNPQEELERLVGCQDIKRRIHELIVLTNYNKLRRQHMPNQKMHIVSLHGLFLGRPGTGKTTVAKIYGSLLKEAGVLSKGHVVVCNRSCFVGRNWGDEEQGVRNAVHTAQGGVLLIDEAYQLVSSHPNDPGRLVIPLLMDILADESQRDIAVILCGYKEQMLQMLELNPGLESRFPNRFEFGDFTVGELIEISLRRIKEYGYRFTKSALEKYRTLIEDAYAQRNPETWGNARFVANLLERIYMKHAENCMLSEHPTEYTLRMIVPDDIEPIPVAKSKRRIGF